MIEEARLLAIADEEKTAADERQRKIDEAEAQRIAREEQNKIEAERLESEKRLKD